MIVGVGLDLVELERVGRIMDQSSGPRFAEKVLTAEERKRWSGLPARRALEYIAGRFAAKEAVVKAIGCGIGATVGFQDVELLADEAGRPVCRLSEPCLRRLGWAADGHTIHVAITHERKLAAATAVVERHAQADNP